MMRIGIAMTGLAAFPACMVDQFTPDVYACTATRSCSNGACEPSELDFSVTPADATGGVSLSLVDRTIPLAFDETTFATEPDGAVTLTTYASADTAVRLTLAEDGSPLVRARLVLSDTNLSRDIAATCALIPGGTG